MTTFDESHHRKSIRLPEFDYSQPGAYFVTIVSHDRKPRFGGIANGEMVLNEIGKMVETVWQEIPNHFFRVNVDTLVVMPNHIHGIIEISEEVEMRARHAEPLRDNSVDSVLEQYRKPVHGSIPTIIRSYKSEATKRFRKFAGILDFPLWQRNYYEHVIRNELDYQSVYDYVQSNPLNWLKDTEFHK